jgi:polyisoprenoid-binding protein YceI
MTADQLFHLLSSDTPPLLIHVLPEEVFACRRITGSQNACVYEMAFTEQVTALAPDKSAPMVVYGAGGGSLDAATAREKLQALGYDRVEVFSGGLEEWAAAGLPLQGSQVAPGNEVVDGHYTASTADSVVRWTGRNLFNHHHGTVRLASGELVIDHGELSAANFEIDMNQIVCEDLTDPTWNATLIRHLRDTDFFDVERYPVASFVSHEAKAINGATAGTPTHLLRGELTLRGITHPLSFPIAVALAGERITAQAQFEVDRTLFGSLYGSGRFFKFLGKHVVNDHFHLHLKIHTDRKS